MKTTVKALAIFFCSLPLLASAGTKANGGAMQVSLVVKEACSVQASGSAAATQRPNVACQFNTPYLMTRTADKPAATDSATGNATRPEAGAQDWTLYF
jgi:hypothetical protein